MPPRAQFTHKLVHTVSRLMIESTCVRCGGASLVSDHDGTLAEWEEGHSCTDSDSESKQKTDRKLGDAS